MLGRSADHLPLGQDRIARKAGAVLVMLIAIMASLALLATVKAAAQTQNTVSAIEIDVTPLRARGVGVFADLLHDSLRTELQARYTIAADAPRLQVTLNSFFLNGNTSIDRSDGDSFGMALQPPLDNLGGEARLVGRDGRVIDTYRLLTNSPATRAAHRPSPEREQIRARALTEVFAGWVARRY